MSHLNDAAEAGNLGRVQVLVERGADKEKTDRYGMTPLIIASRNDYLDVVRYLVEQGADMENANSYGETPLIYASFYGRLEVVRYLLKQGANVNKANQTGYTPLHRAAHSNHLEIAKLLMVYGADLNARNNNLGLLPIDITKTEEIRQAIRDEPQRRWDQQPRKRCVEQDQDQHQDATAISAFANLEENNGEEEEEQTNSKLPAEGGAEEGKVADEDQDSEPSSDEDGN